MKYVIILVCLSLFLFSCGGSKTQSNQSDTAQKKLSSSIDVLNSIISIPDKTIPAEILKNAHGIAVIPNVIKGAFVVSGEYGTGVMSVKLPDGSWSYPSFISLGGGGVGWQWGGESIDLVLVFKNENSIQKIYSGTVTLGVNAGVAAGPVGRNASASTNDQFNAEIYSYSKTEGVFLGAALNGSSLRIDNNTNDAFYNSPKLTAQQIFKNNVTSAPASAAAFRNEVDSITSGNNVKQ